jgi:catechol 2,3-dioxygenase-like lactoylglutathione lyase family enzyme
VVDPAATGIDPAHLASVGMNAQHRTMTSLHLRQVAAAALLVALVASQGSGSQARPLFETRGAFFALSVADLDASTRWYSEKLGLSVVMHPPKQDKSAVTVLEGGGLIVELLQRDDATSLRQAAPSVAANYQVYGMFKAGVIVADLDATLAALRARGVEIAMGPFPASKEQRANAIIRDNAGNFIQVIGAR